MEIMPRQLYENIQLEAENNKIIMQSQLELSRAESLKHKEEELIERADRDNKVANIENPEIQNRIKDELNSLRQKNESTWLKYDDHSNNSQINDSNFIELENDYYNISRTGTNLNDHFVLKELTAISTRINNFPLQLLSSENFRRFQRLKVNLDGELKRLDSM